MLFRGEEGNADGGVVKERGELGEARLIYGLVMVSSRRTYLGLFGTYECRVSRFLVVGWTKLIPFQMCAQHTLRAVR